MMRRLITLGICVSFSIISLFILFSILSSSAAAVASTEQEARQIIMAVADQASSPARASAESQYLAPIKTGGPSEPLRPTDRAFDRQDESDQALKILPIDRIERQISSAELDSDMERMKRSAPVDWAYLPHPGESGEAKNSPAAPLTPQGAYSLTLETVHRNTSSNANSSTLVFTNTGSATSNYTLYFYWPNGQYQSSDGPFVLDAAAALNYDMDTANTGADPFVGKVVIDGDQPLAGMITSPDYGVIAGTVYEDDSLTPLTSAWVDIRSWPNGSDWYANLPVLSNGEYYAGGLPDNSYIVQSGAGYPWARQWYDERSNGRDADPVTISSASLEDDIDFILQPGGLITGTVYASDGFTPLENVNLDLEQGWLGTCTDENGHYTLYDVPYGEHKVVAGRGWNWCTGQQSIYAGEFYYETPDPDLATLVPINSGSDIATGIDFTLEVGGVITGRVSDEFANPLENIYIDASEYYEGYFWGEAWTDASGYYTITGLVEGDYTVCASDEDGEAPDYARECYDNKFRNNLADPVWVGAGETVSDIDFELELGGLITGIVYDQDTLTPIPYLNVHTVREDRNAALGACTDENGVFSLGVLPFGDYQIQAGGSENWCQGNPQQGVYAKKWYDDVFVRNESTYVTIDGGAPQASDIDFYLEEGGFISGRVLVDDGGGGTYPVDEFEIDAVLPDPTCDDCEDWYDGVWTDSNGDYLLGPLPEGEDLAVVACADCSGYLLVNEYYDDALNFFDADMLSVNAGATLPGIDFLLEEGELISGTVSVPGGYSAEGIQIDIWRNDSPDYSTWGETDADGNYLLVVPPIYDREWTVRVLPSGTDLGGARAEEFDLGQQTTWDFDLDLGGVITGRLTSGGAPVPNLRVSADSSWYNNGDRTDANGVFVIENLPPATNYWVRLNPQSGYPQTEYDSPYPGDAYVPVILDLGETRGGLNIETAQAGQIQGYARESDGSTPIEGIKITAFNARDVRYGFSNPDGYYSMDVPAGDYKVAFIPWDTGENYLGAYYPDAFLVKDALTVTVSGGGSISITQTLEKAAILSGKVTDNSSGQPLENIHVAAINIDPTVNRETAWDSWDCTDENGDYQLDKVRPGENEITVVGTCGNEAYGVYTTTFTVSDGGVHTLNISLDEGTPLKRLFTVWDVENQDKTPLTFGGAIFDWNVESVLPMLYTPLTYLDNGGDWHSDLLTQLPSEANGEAQVIDNQLVVTYTLKSGLQWSDGMPLTAKDILFTWRMLTLPNPCTWDPWQVEIQLIWQIESMDMPAGPDGRVVVMTFKPGYIPPSYLSAITYLLPEHVLEGEHPLDVMWDSHYAHYPVGNGPYMVRDWVPGSHLDLVANPNYVLRGSGLPRIEELRLLFTGDAYWQLTNGRVDVVLDGDPGWDLSGYNLKAYTNTFNDWTAIEPNGDLPFFKDPQVRKALYHALDRHEFETHYSPYIISADNYLPPSNPMYTTTQTTYDFNLTTAANKLDAAGWVDTNSNGVRDKDGVELEFDLVIEENKTARQFVASVYQADLASIGVDLNIVEKPTNEYRRDRWYEDYDAIIEGWGYDLKYDPMAYILFHGRMIPSAYNRYDGSLFTGRWRDATNDALLESARQELDSATLKDLYAQHVAYWTDNIPIFPLWHDVRSDIATVTLLNFKPGGVVPPTWNIQEWQVPPNPYDLSVRKALSADSPAPQPGAVITYEISVRNLGYFSMTQAVLFDTLPEEVNYQYATPTPDAITGTRDLRWDLGDILGKTSLSPIKVAVEIPSGVAHGTWLTNTVQVSADQPDNHPGNNGFTHLVEVRDDVDLAIHKYGVGQPAIGEHFDYYIDYGNWGGAPAANTVISDTLPPEVNLLSASRTPSSSDGRTLTWDLGALPGNHWGGQIKLTAEITNTGMVTNLAQIGGSDPDVDLNNNEDDHVEFVDDILTPVILRPTSGTTDGTPTVSGLAPSGSVVTIYDRSVTPGFAPLTTTATMSGTFSLELSLSAGNYILAATATKSGLTSADSNYVGITVDLGLPLDPDLISISADGVDLSNGCVRAKRNILAHRMLDISAVLNCASLPTNVRLQITENGLYTYNVGPSSLTSIGGGQWQVNFHAWLGEAHSTYQIRLLWNCEGTPKSILLLYILIDPDGYLYDQSLVDSGSAISDSLILNGVVTAYVKVADSWQVWPAHIYGQTNPQYTDDSSADGVLTPGYYSFLTPSGKYRIEAAASGYQPFQSEVLTVITTPVHLNIGLQPITGGTGFAKSPANLGGSSKTVDKTSAKVGDELTYDLWLVNGGDKDTGSLYVQDLIPAHTEYVAGSLSWNSGTAAYDSGTGKITWQGTVGGKQTVHVQYKLRIVSYPPYPIRPFIVANASQVSGAYMDTYLLPSLHATTIVNVSDIFLPVVMK
jgi:peptide/nickel transport system substrate-binding protein